MSGVPVGTRAERMAASKAIRELPCPRCHSRMQPHPGSGYARAICVGLCAASYVPVDVVLTEQAGTPGYVASFADPAFPRTEYDVDSFAHGVLVTAADLDRIGARHGLGEPRLAGSGARVRTEMGLSSRTYRTWFVEVDDKLVNHFVSVDEYAGHTGRGGTLWVVEVGSHGLLGTATWSARTPPSPKDVARLAAFVWPPA